MKNLFRYSLLLLLAFTLFNCASKADVSTNDGSSVEKAIKVHSIDQEYAYVRKVCADCELKGQSLISNDSGTKHYDVLTMVKPGGEEVSYYFNITSFFGKF